MKRSEEVDRKYKTIGLWQVLAWVGVFVSGYGVWIMNKNPTWIYYFLIGLALLSIGYIESFRIRREIRELERI